MKAEAWKDVDAGGGIGASEKWNVGLVELFDDVELMFDEFLPDGKRIGVEVLDDSGREFGPAFLAPECGRIFAVRIFRHVDGVNEPLASLPVESRALPGLISCEQLNQGSFTRRVVSFEEPAGTFRSFQ